MNGLISTMMDLIDRNYLILSNKTSNGEYNSSGSLFLEINPDYDPDTLWDFEVGVLNFLQEYEQNGVISMDSVSESLNYVNSAKFFENFYKDWKNEVKDDLWNDGNLKEVFLRKGDKFIKAFGIMGLISSIVVFFVIFPNSWTLVFDSYLFFLFYMLVRIRNKEGRLIIYGISGLMIVATALFRVFSGPLTAVEVVFISTILLGAVSVISIILPEKIAGQWTPYGREYYAQWRGFKKYIEDYSLMKEYSPESIKVWNRYLVYATALGDAKGVRKAMELSLPEDTLSETDLYMFHYYSSPVSLFTNAIKTALESD